MSSMKKRASADNDPRRPKRSRFEVTGGPCPAESDDGNDNDPDEDSDATTIVNPDYQNEGQGTNDDSQHFEQTQLYGRADIDLGTLLDKQAGEETEQQHPNHSGENGPAEESQQLLRESLMGAMDGAIGRGKAPVEDFKKKLADKESQIDEARKVLEGLEAEKECLCTALRNAETKYREFWQRFQKLLEEAQFS